MRQPLSSRRTTAAQWLSGLLGVPVREPTLQERDSYQARITEAERVADEMLALRRAAEIE
ncbi:MULTISPECIES: hypothetical protein [Actinoplanes]|uniref:hypothetical protein n=1 Tax=Actinoplanes TaxID=1865 RepID=UPI0005F2DBDC|nr:MULTISPECIES: hypothetical protein [Actinoplanes]GLY02904.1 hypothetical protein Acsp01_32830 [Actinoplanes sp. NBRC 101535]